MGGKGRENGRGGGGKGWGEEREGEGKREGQDFHNLLMTHATHNIATSPPDHTNLLPNIQDAHHTNQELLVSQTSIQQHCPETRPLLSTVTLSCWLTYKETRQCLDDGVVFDGHKLLLIKPPSPLPPPPPHPPNKHVVSNRNAVGVPSLLCSHSLQERTTACQLFSNSNPSAPSGSEIDSAKFCSHTSSIHSLLRTPRPRPDKALIVSEAESIACRLFVT